MDRVGARHQRRVQRRRHLADDLEADQDRQHEDRQRVEQLRAHAAPPAAGGGSSSLRVASWTTSPSWVMTVAAVISSAHVELQRAVLDAGEQEQLEDVAGVELARAGGHRGRQVGRRDDRHAVVGHDRLVRPSTARRCHPARWPPCRRSPSRGFIARTAVGGDQQRRPAAGHLGGGDDHVHAGDVAVELVLLRRLAPRGSARARSRPCRSRRRPT